MSVRFPMCLTNSTVHACLPACLAPLPACLPAVFPNVWLFPSPYHLPTYNHGALPTTLLPLPPVIPTLTLVILSQKEGSTRCSLSPPAVLVVVVIDWWNQNL